MAALTADRNTPYREGELIPVPVKAGVKIYAGAIVVVDAGYAKPGVKAANLIYLGRAEEQVDNSATGASDGDKSVLVRRKRSFYWSNATGTNEVAQADVGKPAYIFDDQTITDVDTGASKAGDAIILAVDSGGVWIG